MTNEEKDLLLKDLCSRLPYCVKCEMTCWDEELGEVIRPVTLYSINKDGYCYISEDDYSPYIEEIKPYLFPFSSMTEEQKEDMIKSSCGIGLDKNVFDWYNKNHFDWRGLIPKGLANDATGLNIY